MAQRLIRLPWQQQPQEVVLRPSEQYADLHAGWLGSQPGVLVGAAGAAWSRVGSPTIEPSRAGLASRAASYSTAAYYTGPSISGASLAWPGITVVAVLPAFVSVGSDFPAAVCIAPTGEYYGVGTLSFQVSGYNSILWRPGDSGNHLTATAYNNTALGHEWAAGEDLVIVARWDKATARIAVNRSGSIMRNSASHSYGWRSGTNLMQIGGHVRSGNRMLVSPLAMAAVLPRDVGDRAESELLDNPWGLFEFQRIWVPVSSGGSNATIAGATTSATASLIAGSLTAGSAIAGQTLAAAASLLPGQLVAGAQLAGQTLAASASLVPGDLRAGSTIAGTTLAAGASLLPGSLIGQGDATISGATLSAAATLIPGALSSSGNAQTIAGATMSVTSSIIVGNLLAGATLPGQVVGASAILVPGVLFDASAAGGLRQARLHVGIGLRI